MTAVVLDASAGAELVARTTLGRALLGVALRDRTWWAPDHFHVEVAAAIRRMLLAGLIDESRADEALAQLLSLPISIARSSLLIGEAWRHRFNVTIDDGVYVALARHLDARGSPLTAGWRLRRVVGFGVLHISSTS